MMNRPMKPYKTTETPEITKVRKPSDNRKINVNFKKRRRSPKPANGGVTGKTMVCPTGLEPTAFRVGGDHLTDKPLFSQIGRYHI